MSKNVIEQICEECKRIEEDACYSGKGHYYAAFIWSCMHYFIGISVIVSATIASVQAPSNMVTFVEYLSLAVVGLGALQTFLSPDKKSAEHTSAGSAYLSLKNQVRVFKNITLNKKIESNEAEQQLLQYVKERDLLNRFSPQIPLPAYWLAKYSIKKGTSTYAIDNDIENDD